MKNLHIGIIGGGNMGSAIVGGLIKNHYHPDNIWLVDRGVETCQQLQALYHIHVSTDPLAILSQVDMLILAVKPQSMKSLILDIKSHFDASRTNLISIAAGITTAHIQSWFGMPQLSVIRAMPNTPALIGEGITGLYANPNTTLSARTTAEQILLSCGKTVWIQQEPWMDIVTALSGSGPAYFFYIWEMMIAGAKKLGLPQELASELTINTALGAAAMAVKSQEPLATLREKVTSKGGTTEEGIKALKDGKLENLIFETLNAAYQRAKEISEQIK